VRHGTERGSVTLGGRRVPVQRPRVRAADGTGELPVPAYELFSSTEVLGRLAMEKMLAGLSSRRYGPVGLEPVGKQVTATAKSTSKSAVSRKFVAQTETALAQLLAADLSQLDLLALMVDGVHFAQTFRPDVLRRRARDRPAGQQDPARAGRGRDRERHPGHRTARRPA
jgi:putative transposase